MSETGAAVPDQLLVPLLDAAADVLRGLEVRKPFRHGPASVSNTRSQRTDRRTAQP